MWIAAVATFFVALSGIVVLFVRKARSVAVLDNDLTDASYTRADDYALALKERIMKFVAWTQTLPAVGWLLVRYGIHRGAKGFARFARISEDAAHRLADRVSHRHRFERGTHTSEYLRQVGEVKESIQDKQI